MDEAEKSFINDVKEQCSSAEDKFKGDTARRLGFDSSKLRGTAEYQKITEAASKHGLGEEQVMGLFDRLLGAIDDVDQPIDRGTFDGNDFYKTVEDRVLEMADKERASKINDLLKDTIQSTFGKSGRGLEPRGPIATQCDDFVVTFKKWVSANIVRLFVCLSFLVAAMLTINDWFPPLPFAV
jgi:hypothetical protein